MEDDWYEPKIIYITYEVANPSLYYTLLDKNLQKSSGEILLTELTNNSEQSGCTRGELYDIIMRHFLNFIKILSTRHALGTFYELPRFDTLPLIRAIAKADNKIEFNNSKFDDYKILNSSLHDTTLQYNNYHAIYTFFMSEYPKKIHASLHMQYCMRAILHNKVLCVNILNHLEDGYPSLSILFRAQELSIVFKYRPECMKYFEYFLNMDGSTADIMSLILDDVVFNYAKSNDFMQLVLHNTAWLKLIKHIHKDAKQFEVLIQNRHIFTQHTAKDLYKIITGTEDVPPSNMSLTMFSAKDNLYALIEAVLVENRKSEPNYTLK